MTTIPLTDLTNGSLINQEWVGTGIFDILMSAMNKNIETQFVKGRITGTDYATTYLGGLQVVLQQSADLLLRKDLTAAQIDGIIADNDIKAKELDIKQQELLLAQQQINALLKDIDVKERGMVVQESKLADDLLTSIKQRAAIDEDIAVKIQQVKNLYTEQVIKDKEAAKLGLDNVVKLAEEARLITAGYVYLPKYGV